MEINQPKSIKPKMRGHKLVNWQRVLKQIGVKQGLGVDYCAVSEKLFQLMPCFKTDFGRKKERERDLILYSELTSVVMPAKLQVKIIPGVQTFWRCQQGDSPLPTLRICNITVCSTALLSLMNQATGMLPGKHIICSGKSDPEVRSNRSAQCHIMYPSNQT